MAVVVGRTPVYGGATCLIFNAVRTSSWMVASLSALGALACSLASSVFEPSLRVACLFVFSSLVPLRFVFSSCEHQKVRNGELTLTW